ncbi:ALP1-like protein [Tanacetum coccineum]
MMAAMTAATKTFNILSVMIRWFRLGCLIINHMLESNTLRKKYRMNFGKRHANMWSMVYQSDITSMVNIRMNRRAFKRLCEYLESKGGLCNSKHMLVDEQVAMFLDTLTHNEKNRIIVNRFQRSGETIMPDNETDERWKWFKGCLGALDGKYIKVRVPTDDRKPYRTRKGEICTNVLGVCTRDLVFSYVLAGWEGSAADSRVLRDAISRPNGLKIPRGTYYLCDAGYTNGEGFLTPFRGQRYHLNDWSNPPTTAKELYNKKHSSTRNVIERCFGLIKARWAILRDNSYHPIESMPLAVDHIQDGNEHDDVISTVEISNEWSDQRYNLANAMFNEFNI